MAKSKTTEVSQPTKRAVRPLPITSMQDLVIAGELISKTKIIGDLNPADGFVIASICYQHDVPYDEFAATYNFMHGRLTKKADAILADLCALGGTYELLERTSEVARAKFSYAGNTREFEVTFEALRNEPFIYAGKEQQILPLLQAKQFNKLSIKVKYATERARMQMLWARCVSDGVRAVCPAACKGIYTPEEVDDFGDDPIPPIGVTVPMPQAPGFNPPASVAPQSSPVEICPIGQFAGQKWDELETSILEMVGDLQDPAITNEMKQYVSQILAERKESQNV